MGTCCCNYFEQDPEISNCNSIHELIKTMRSKKKQFKLEYSSIKIYYYNSNKHKDKYHVYYK